MNALERWFCSSGLWQYVTRTRLLPWVLSGCELGDCVLEIGAGAGAATAELHRRTKEVVSLEYDPMLAARLAARSARRWMIVRGDASRLPFADQTFSTVISILTFHHLRSRQLQDDAFSEVHRVLRRSGQFLVFDIQDGWWHRFMHRRSTFVPLDPRVLPQRLQTAGLKDARFVFQGKNFRLQAIR